MTLRDLIEESNIQDERVLEMLEEATMTVGVGELEAKLYAALEQAGVKISRMLSVDELKKKAATLKGRKKKIFTDVFDRLMAA